MAFSVFIWDEDDDPRGNSSHIAEHDVSKEEVEEVLRDPEDRDHSRSSGRPIYFGYTAAGRYLAIVVEPIDAITAYPITAYEVEPG